MDKKFIIGNFLIINSVITYNKQITDLNNVILKDSKE